LCFAKTKEKHFPKRKTINKEQSKRSKEGNFTCSFFISQLIANYIKIENETEEYIGRAETFNFCLLSDDGRSTSEPLQF